MKLVVWIYTLICVIAPVTYGLFPDFVLFGNEFDSSLFTRDSTYTSGLLISPMIAFIKDNIIRRNVSVVFIIEAIIQVAFLLFSDNNFNLPLTLINSIFFLFVTAFFLYGNRTIQ